MARAETKTIPAQQALSGKALVGRFFVLEAIVIALGAAALPKDPDQRKTFLDELHKDATTRAHSSGHDEVQAETDSYLDEVFEAMTTASQT